MRCLDRVLFVLKLQARLVLITASRLLIIIFENGQRVKVLTPALCRHQDCRQRTAILGWFEWQHLGAFATGRKEEASAHAADRTALPEQGFNRFFCS